MGKNKWQRFKECETFDCMIQADFEDIFGKSHDLKGNWSSDFFKNDNPIVLELGCGRGEYTVSLAKKYPNINFIGVDIKGARMWRGAKTATEDKMNNVAFVRTRIEFINSFFDNSEVSGLWITFPDPQLKKARVKKRLTSPVFLKSYAEFLKKEGSIHLKTDSQHLHQYTLAVADANHLPVEVSCNDIYNHSDKMDEDLLSIRTTYESKFLKLGMAITYIKFSLDGKMDFVKPDFPLDDTL